LEINHDNPVFHRTEYDTRPLVNKPIRYIEKYMNDLEITTRT